MPASFNGGGGGLWLVGLQEGVKDFVWEEGVFVIKVIVGSEFCVYVVAFYGVHVGTFFVIL
jgi:hypothetical protein